MLHLIVLFLSACGGNESSTPPSSTPQPLVPSTPSPALEVHEWGLVDAILSQTHARVAGAPIVPEPHPMPTRAPLLYFHLPAGAAPVEASIRVQLAGGSFLETWPLAEAQQTVASWTATIRPGNCAGTRRAVRGQPPCLGTDPCESIHLPQYETSDGACVHVGDADYDHLFYTGMVPFSIPLEIVRTATGVRVRNPGVELPGAVLYVHREQPSATTIVHSDSVTSGATITMLDQGPSDGDARADFSSPMHDLGLTDQEGAAFERAWVDALFGATPGQPIDAVLFWLPEAQTDTISRLAIEPAPTRVRRAFLVRVNLDGATPEP